MSELCAKSALARHGSILIRLDADCLNHWVFRKLLDSVPHQHATGQRPLCQALWCHDGTVRLFSNETMQQSGQYEITIEGCPRCTCGANPSADQLNQPRFDIVISGLLVVSNEPSCHWGLIEDTTMLHGLDGDLVAEATHRGFRPLAAGRTGMSSSPLVNVSHRSFLDENRVSRLNATVHRTPALGCPPSAVAKDAAYD